MFADPNFAGREDLYEIVTSYGSDIWKATGVDQPARKLSSHADQPDVYAYQFLWGTLDETGAEPAAGPVWVHPRRVPRSRDPLLLRERPGLCAAFSYLLFTEQNRPGREALSDAMMQYAAQFARTGDPNTPGSGLPEWQPWSNETGGPKCILFNVDEDQALDIKMATVELTVEGVLETMAAEVPEPLLTEAAEYLGPWGERFSSE